jgi:hypothetical protein
MGSKMLEGYTSVPLTLPHTGEVVACQPLPLAKAAVMLRLWEASRVSDGALADLMEQFPLAIQVPATAFDGLTPAEFASVVGDFFSVHRGRTPAAVAPATLEASGS